LVKNARTGFPFHPDFKARCVDRVIGFPDVAPTAELPARKILTDTNSTLAGRRAGSKKMVHHGAEQEPRPQHDHRQPAG
jgi:hypothetical protein